MSYRTLITIRAALARFNDRIINQLLGSAARAGQIVADADARLIGMVPAPLMVSGVQPTPFFNHLGCMTSS